MGEPLLIVVPPDFREDLEKLGRVRKMNEMRQQQIRFLADSIRAKIRDGRLYGETIDVTDMDQILVAAYLIGQMSTNNPGWSTFMSESKFEQGKSGDYRKARGCLQPNDNAEPPEDIIRRARDA